MSLLPVYVRARDAAFYRNPVVVFPEGFLCFDEHEPPELVLWVEVGVEPPDPLPVIAARFGPEHGVFGIQAPRLAQRAVPGVDPLLFKPAAAFFVQLGRRIPRPRFNEGAVRRMGRAGPAHVLDLPANPRDAHELEIF